MNYEKKYKEALKRARELVAQWTGKNKDFYIEDYSYIFPELRESEDERIRKWLVDYFGSIKEAIWIHRDITCEQILAYLEKQKEQKPNQSEEEREYVKTLKGLVSDFIRDSGGAISDVTYYQRICDWLDERHIEQKQTEYLDKDKVYAVMKKLHKLAFSQLIPINSDEYKKIDEITCDIRNFLNYPVEQNPAWSEEDENYLGVIVRLVEQVSGWPERAITEYTNWLKKSLRPSWKPSEEQMKGLKFFLDFHRPQRNAGTTNWKEFDAVESLYEQLKKL